MAEISSISQDRAHGLMKRATFAAVSVAAVLIATKLGAWLITDSISLLASLVDSVMDVLASMINLIAVRHALQPPDREHRFGHGKLEPLASLGQAAFITGSGLFLIVEAVGRLIRPQLLDRGAVGIGVMVFSIVATACLVLYQRRVVRLTGSTAIKADSLHYASDVLVNGGVIVALILATTLGWSLADPLVAIGVAGFIIFSAARIAVEAFNHLMDRELPDEDRDRIKRIALQHPAVLDCHDLKTRRSGIDTFIQIHLEMRGSLSLNEVHDISDEVEADIQAAFPTAEIIIHADPEGIQEPRQTFGRA